jgi:hypothetical protein
MDNAHDRKSSGRGNNGWGVCEARMKATHPWLSETCIAQAEHRKHWLIRQGLEAPALKLPPE